MASPKRLLVIHHSHTDIGYTELQHRITRWQVDFIRQAIVAAATNGRLSPPFKWTCESFWAVEQFWNQADPDEKRSFLEAVRVGSIGLSANYLNLNETLDYETVSSMIGRASSFANQHDLPLSSAMTADINGFGWGFARALTENGISNLFTCVHTHHGMYPLGKLHQPFWWEASNGERLLVWNGHHYHFGNELGLVPGAVSSYMTKDECDAEMIYHDHWAVAEIRIPRLFKQLEEDGYPYDFLPVMASGLRTDNAPPNRAIVDMIERWNAEHGDEIQIEMATLDDFFTLLREQDAEIPVYRGDWPDWWSDGFSAASEATRLYLEAKRSLGTIRELDGHEPGSVPLKDIEALEKYLTMYAEHTFGHAASVTKPWMADIQANSAFKKGMAASVLQESKRVLDDWIIKQGGSLLEPNRPLEYTVFNPSDCARYELIDLPVENHEYYEHDMDKGTVVIETKSGAPLPFLKHVDGIGPHFLIPIEMKPHERLSFKIESKAGQLDSYDPEPETVPDHIVLENDRIKLSIKSGEGIVEIIDKKSGNSLIHPDAPHLPFTLIHEVTPQEGENSWAVRSAMEQNRKGEGVIRSAADFGEIRSIKRSEIIDVLEIPFVCEGTEHGLMTLTMHKTAAKLDASIRFMKTSKWDPENIYLALPFFTGNDEQLWVDKAGEALRPWVDQIPGTLTDFYCLQDGFAIVAPSKSIAISMPDSPLLQLGPLEYGERRLHDAGSALLPSGANCWAWLMSNYWETNFDATMGGFHEFRFSLNLLDGGRNPSDAIKIVQNANKRALIWRHRNEKG